ncbi:MAG: cupin domain-containing protein [Peptostreptococcaceae bacterium]|nr:cupin domain-containing protein [Peptostreptococcaceae bacterium]
MAGFKNIVKGEVFTLKEQIDYRKHRIISLTICDTEKIRMVLFSFDEEEAITEEQTPNTERFTLIEGRMEVVVDGRKYLLHEKESLWIPPEAEHSLLALAPSKMLQTSLK